MASYTLSPSLVFKGFYDDNTPLVGGKVYTWLAGTITPVDTYQSNGGAANLNPVILNARGEANIWLDPAISYKIEVQDEDGNIIIPAKDNITVGDITELNAITIETVSALRAYDGTATLVYLRGYSEENDGCGGWLYYSPDISDPDDGVIVFAKNASPMVGRFVRDYSGGPISVRYAGDNGSLSASDDQLQLCLARIVTYGGTLYHPPGVYFYNDNHTVDCEWRPDEGALIAIQTDNTITVTGKITHPPSSLIYRPTGYLGSISLSNADGTIAYPEWFGAVGNGATNDLAAINRCFITGCYLYEFPSVSGYLISAPASLPGTYTFNAKTGVFESGPSYQINAGLTTSASFHTAGAIFATGDINGDNITAGGNINAAGDANITGSVSGAAAIIGGGGITSIGDIDVSAGGISVSNGVAAGSGIEAGGDITGHSDLNLDGSASVGGSLTLTGSVIGDLDVTGAITASSDLISTSGGVFAQGGAVSASTNVTAGTYIDAAAEIVSGAFVQAKAGASPANFKASGRLHASTSVASTSGTGATNLKAYQLLANSLSSDGDAIRITGGGNAESGGARTIALTRTDGGGTITLFTSSFTAPSGNCGWKVIADIVRTSSTTATIGWMAVLENQTLASPVSVFTFAIAFGSDITYTFVGTAASSNGINQNMMLVDIFPT